MRKGNFQVINTFGDRAQDEEIQRLIGRIEALEQATAPTTTTKPTPVVGSPVQPAAIEVKEVDGDPDLFVFGLEFDSADGFSVSSDGDFARIDLAGNVLLDGNVHNDTLAGTVVKGDLVAGNATPKWSRIGVGSNGQVLTADSAQGQGVKWATPAGTTNALLDGTNHTDTVAQTVVKGALVVGNNTPKWDELTVGSDTQVLTADSSQTKGVKWAAIPASGGAGLANFSSLRWRANQAGIGSNITGIDSSYFQIAATDGANFPGGATKQANFRHDSAILRGNSSNQWVMWGRLKVTVASQPQTLNWFVPNVDDNLYVVIEKPTDLAGTISILSGATAVVGTGTAFLTDFAVGDAIRFGGGVSGATGNEIMYVSAIADNTHLTLGHTYNRGGLAIAGSNYTVCKKVYETHNQVAQTPVNQKSSISLTTNGAWFLHIFNNNDGNTAGAFNFATDLVDNTNFTLADCGAETF